VEYAYDLANKVLQVSDPTGTYGFAYDNMGRLVGTSTSYAFLSGPTFTNSYTYDAASNRTSLTAPDGSITTYGYDTLNRLNGLANSWAGSFGFTYDALSRRTQLTRPNGVNTNYSYDSVSHLLSVLHQAGVNAVDGASYTYDPAGNRTAKSNYLNGITSNYTYDALYELTQVTQGAGTTESYSYDVVGNRLSSSGVPTYSYNPSNELTSNSLGSYSYDANGNTLSDASGKSYSWDFENRLVSAVVPGTGTVAFKYDPFGRRIYKGSSTWTGIFAYDGDNLIETMTPSGSVVADYADSPAIDEPLAQLRSGTTSFYEQDGLASVTSLSSGTGTVSNTYTYNSFGMLTASTGAVTNPLQYTGREFDSETGIYEYRARYYDERVGRFIGEDPIRFKAGPNFYEYVNSNPVALKDAYGLQAECTLVGQYQVTPWIPTATISSQTPWIYKDSAEIDDKGIAIVRCKWERTVTKALWGSALFASKYRCVDKLPCGLTLAGCGKTRRHRSHHWLTPSGLLPGDSSARSDFASIFPASPKHGPRTNR
jgi:RHS repeat-associated protein